MKKIKFLCLLLLLTGCSKAELVKVCTINTIDEDTNYTIKSTFRIYAKDESVEQVKIKEIIKAQDNEELEILKEMLNSTYESANKEYGGYTNKIEEEKNKIISNTTIDYTKMDLKKYVKDNPAMDEYIKNNKISIDGIISIYEEMGASCK